MTDDEDGQSQISVTTDEGVSVVEQASEGIRQAAHGMGVAYQRAQKPGMPLSILRNIAREAPLGSLLIAFLLGVAVARRR